MHTARTMGAARTAPLLVGLLLGLAGAASALRAGVGIYDVTGPATEVDFMGYAMPGQTGLGLHTRLYARAFIFEDTAGHRAVYVSTDTNNMPYGIWRTVVERLQAVYGSTLYTHENVMVHGTHTHAGPGAYSWYLLYDITTLGFNKKHFAAVVDGIVLAIQRAHEDLAATPAAVPVSFRQGMLQNASRNRSPSSYLANPAAERAEYEVWGGDVDKNMTVVRVGTKGCLAFFSVHCTSMHNTNRLVSSDNKGHASYLLERTINGNASIPGRGPFVAAFGQSNEGDVSPNILGAWCDAKVGGTYCGNNRSLCDGKNKHCVSVGAAGFDDDVGSTRINGEKQFRGALALLEAAKAAPALADQVQSAFTFVNISDMAVSAAFARTGKAEHTCRPAMGFSFAAGTTDGPGDFDFYQGDNCTKCLPFWEAVKNFIKKPTPEQIACQAPKPVLLDVGEIEPHPWTPLVVPVQLIKVGELVLVGLPGEFTTMAGRRIRKTVEAAFARHGQRVTPVIAGLANTYASYVTTYEEYQFQRYEAASTLYGPHTAAAYRQVVDALATAIATNAPVPPTTGPERSFVNFSLLPGVIVDTHPLGKEFGDVEADVSASYARGEAVSASFWGANLRNDYHINATFLEVQHQAPGGGAWTTLLTDSNFETRVHWARHGVSSSIVTCEILAIPDFLPVGAYRLVHHGTAKPDPLSSTLSPYTGTSSTFQVTA